MLFLVAREFDEFSRILSERGFTVINCSTITTTLVEDLSDFEEKLHRLPRFDGLFLTSRKATEIFRKRLGESKSAFGGKVYVFGRRGFDLLKHEGLDLYFDDSAVTVQEMLEGIDPTDLKGKRFLIICGELSLSVVQDYLSRTSKVEKAIVYRTSAITVEPSKRAEIQIRAIRGEIGFMCFFSPSGANSFLKQFGTEVLKNTMIATIGKTTADYFAERNLKVDFISPKPTGGDFANGLIEYLKSPIFHKAVHPVT
jgi:uroporphyrinogen-III synthase